MTHVQLSDPVSLDEAITRALNVGDFPTTTGPYPNPIGIGHPETRPCPWKSTIWRENQRRTFHKSVVIIVIRKGTLQVSVERQEKTRVNAWRT